MFFVVHRLMPNATTGANEGGTVWTTFGPAKRTRLAFFLHVESSDRSVEAFFLTDRAVFDVQDSSISLINEAQASSCSWGFGPSEGVRSDMLVDCTYNHMGCSCGLLHISQLKSISTS
jgi:hypothetical protein